jgi:hypothetical protein
VPGRGVSTVADADYAVVGSESTIAFTALTATRTVTVPSSESIEAGQTLTIADLSGHAMWFPIVILGEVNGGPAAVLRDANGKVQLLWTGSEWVTNAWAPWAPPPTITGDTYYVSPTGSDSNDGLSPSTPLQTVTHVNGLALNPGDGVLFRGGETFSDNFLTPCSSGTISAPTVYGSYGTGKAILTEGVYALASALYTVIDNLHLTRSTAGGNIVQLGNASNLCNHATIQRCEISDVGDTATQQIGLTLNGSGITIVGNYIHDMPAHGMLIGSNDDGNSGGYAIRRNLIYNTGLNESMPFNPHAIYGDAHDVSVADNTFLHWGRSSAVSQRYRGWAIEDNHFAAGGVGIEFLQTDTIPGQSTWRRNTIVNVCAGDIYVGSADNGNHQALESLRIVENVLGPLANANSLNLHDTTGGYEVWGNVWVGGSHRGRTETSDGPYR